MSQKIKALAPSVLRSFGELPRDFVVEPFVKWDATAFRINAVELATRSLAFWLDARLAELVLEKVPVKDVVVRTHGSRTVIYARGVPRFEFKLKMSMEKCDGG